MVIIGNFFLERIMEMLDATIIILESMTITDGKLTYSLVQTDPRTRDVEGRLLKDLVLTIDKD